ncbi:MAG: alkane 1-monooxygenase [Proteobacteria bacterium]|nr:alkane 1-monooxygenase [Pseudomonadota bacterium]
MSQAVEAPGAPASSWMATIRVWSLHLLCFSMPLISLVFVLSGPHPWWLALLGLVPGFAIYTLDKRSAAEHRQPHARLPGWPFDSVLFVLAALQIVNVVAMTRMVSQAGFASFDFVIAPIIVATSSGWSGIVVAHELIHRKSKLSWWMGRVLMGTVLYEHFTTEHLRGHHLRVGTPEDPATARYDETFWHFLRRTLPGQFRSAWRLECRRLGDSALPLWDRRQWGNRVLQGLVAQWAFALALGFAFGAAGFVAFVAQAFMAVVLLEAVNYFEHWGLERTSPRVRPTDSWDTDSWFTLYSLVGLSRHADHHAHASRPYQQLRYWEESPKLPSGYIVMVDMVIGRNREFRELMRAELERRRMGPFAEDS